MSVDVHTHMYLPRYVQVLRDREQLPIIRKTEGGEDRLIILPGEDKV
jgi:aminocarboxymuconate-semialdehyde decarboxylase